MARKRMISPTIWEDPGFNKRSRDARLLFIGMFSNADDQGYLRGDAGSLKRLVFGFDELDIKEVQKLIDDLKELRSLHFYQDNGEMFAHFVKWHEYQIQQKERIQASIYPVCSTCVAGDKQLLTQVSKLSKESKQVSKESESLKKLRERFGKKHSI